MNKTLHRPGRDIEEDNGAMAIWQICVCVLKDCPYRTGRDNEDQEEDGAMATWPMWSMCMFSKIVLIWNNNAKYFVQHWVIQEQLG